MSFRAPTLGEIIAANQGDLESRIPGADAWLPVSAMQGIAFAKSGADDDFYAYLVNRSKQLFPRSATYNLVSLAAQKGIFQKGVQATVLTLSLTGTNGTVDAGTVLQRRDGVQYTTRADATLVGGAATVSVVSIVPSAASNCTTGTQLAFVSPVPGIASTVAVAGTVQSGADQETLDALRGRLTKRWQQPPQGGAYSDYVGWAEAVPGVTRAWAFPLWMGAGTIGVTFVMDSNPVSIIPGDGDLANVAAAIGVWGTNIGPRPVTARPYVFAPVATPLDPAIRLNPNNATLQALVTQSLADVIAREAQPGGSLVLGN